MRRKMRSRACAAKGMDLRSPSQGYNYSENGPSKIGDIGMPSAAGYPATRYEPSTPVDLSAKVERERLSASAIKAFLNIMAKWEVRDADARALLGGMSNGQFYEMKKNPQ